MGGEIGMRTTVDFISELCTASLAPPLWLKATLTVAQVTATCSVRQVKKVCTAAEEVWGFGYGNIDTNQFKDIYTIRNQAQPIHNIYTAGLEVRMRIWKPIER